MRGGWAWVLAIVAGIAVVLIATAAIGNRDKSGETVPAEDWAQSVCGVIGTYRGEMEAIVEQIRTPPTKGSLGVEEPQSETPQGRRGLIRQGLQEAVRATKTMVDGLDNAGTPDTSGGSDAAAAVSGWADASVDRLEKAQDSLEHEADTLEGAVQQVTSALNDMGAVLATGVKTVADIARNDTELAKALSASSTCRQLHEEESST